VYRREGQPNAVGSPRPDRRPREGQRRKIVDRVNSVELGEAPPHGGGLARGRQSGAQILLLCGLDLVAGKRVKIVDETDSGQVAKPWLPSAIAGRCGVGETCVADDVALRRSTDVGHD
jgi:hypothetical protein